MGLRISCQSMRKSRTCRFAHIYMVGEAEGGVLLMLYPEMSDRDDLETGLASSSHSDHVSIPCLHPASSNLPLKMDSSGEHLLFIFLTLFFFFLAPFLLVFLSLSHLLLTLPH